MPSMHMKLLYGFILSILLAIACKTSTQKPVEPAMRLAWSDEFDYTGLPDSVRWSYDTGGDGWGNNELQFYTSNRPENARVENGHLVIEARHENWQSRDYTSARLIS